MREKQIELLRWGGVRGIKVSIFFIVARVRNNVSLYQSFLYAFRRGAGSCPQWRVSVIARCAQGESRLYLLGIPVNGLLLNLKSHSTLHEPPMT